MYPRTAASSTRTLLRLGLPLLLAAILLLLGLGLVAAQGPIRLTRATIASPSGRESENASLSADGSSIAFQSDSDFLGQGNVALYQEEIWLYDSATMTVTRVTTASASDRYSLGPSISADGTRIAFHSDSDFLGLSLIHI